MKTGVRTESQEGHGQESQEGERRRRKKSRAKELKKGTTSEPGPLVIFVSAGTGEKKEIIQKRLEVAWNAKPGALIFTLDRDTNTRLQGNRTTQKYVEGLLEIGKSHLVNDGAILHQHIFSNEAGANIAICWDMNSLLCEQFEVRQNHLQSMACDGYTASPTEPTSHTLLFKMTIAHKKEVVHCAIMQIEGRIVNPRQLIQDVWNQLPMPCLIAGNLLCPREHGKELRNGIDLEHDPGKERYFQAYDAHSLVWPQPFFIAALGAQMQAAQKPTEPNLQSTLVTQLYFGSVSEQEAASQEELESDEDTPQVTEPATAENVGGTLVESWAAFALGIMGCCCGDQGLSETTKQRLEEIAQGEANRILDLEDGPPGRSQEVCKEIRNLAGRIGWTKQGVPRSFWPRLSWWVKCDLCKRYVREMHTTRHYEEPLHDVLTKCNTYLARENWSVGKKQSWVMWTISDDDRYPHLKMWWTNRDDKRRFKAFVRQDIGHKDLPYFIWTHGLPGCLQPEITTTADLDGYTKDLVHWLWKLAKYIVVTKQEIGIFPHRMKRMRRQADNAAMIRRLWNSL